MTEPSNIPIANALYNEQLQVQAAITLIDAGGLMTSFSVWPPPADGPPLPSVTIVNTVSTPATMTALRAQLVARDKELMGELAALGVT